MKPEIPGAAAARPVDLVDLLDRARVGPFHLRVLAICVAIAMLDGFDTQAIAFVAPVLAAEWQVPMSQFSAAFAIGLVGLTVGALVFGPAADRFGRKKVLLACTAAFGLFALLTAWSTSFSGLLWLRFLTGIGLGGAMPNIIAMTSEYAPHRLRATAVTAMFCGFPLGSVLGGFLAARIIPVWGWETVFLLGGALPLLFVPVLALALPESVRFLVGHERDPEGVRSIIRRVCGDQAPKDPAARFFLPEKKISGLTVRHLFTERRLPSTLLLWLAFFCNLLVMYFLVNWLPALLKQSGYPLDTAIYATSTLNFGGVVGGLAVGMLIDRTGPFTVLGTAYAVAAVFIGVMATASQNPALLYGSLFVVGIGVVGAQIGMNAVASSLYPTTLRSTGIGWALGIGRLGSILGPMVGGVMLAGGWAPQAILQVSLWPAAIAALAVFALGRVVRRRAAAATVAA